MGHHFAIRLEMERAVAAQAIGNARSLEAVESIQRLKSAARHDRRAWRSLQAAVEQRRDQDAFAISLLVGRQWPQQPNDPQPKSTGTEHRT